MNSAHLEFCASPEWRTIVEEMILPDALRNVELGTEVIEIGPGPGFTTDVLRNLTDHLVAVEVDPDLAVSLESRLEGTNVRVVRGDATSLDFPDDRFSGAASFHMLHHIATDDAQIRRLRSLPGYSATVVL
jgi:16S rRNA A1518/A1519 N6-dimethyltransferase RsmA/KsgA/DIM1 with predicted DNA glycosylase/AP lyase activity